MDLMHLCPASSYAYEKQWDRLLRNPHLLQSTVLQKRIKRLPLQ